MRLVRWLLAMTYPTTLPRVSPYSLQSSISVSTGWHVPSATNSQTHFLCVARVRWRLQRRPSDYAMSSGQAPADPGPSARAASRRALRSAAAAGETLSSRSAMSRSRDPSSVPVRRRGPWRRPPRGDRLVREPDRQRAALSQPSLIISPVRHLVAGLRNPMATVGIVFVRHGQAGRSGRGFLSIQCHSSRQPPHPCTKPG